MGAAGVRVHLTLDTTWPTSDAGSRSNVEGGHECSTFTWSAQPCCGADLTAHGRGEAQLYS